LIELFKKKKNLIGFSLKKNKNFDWIW